MKKEKPDRFPIPDELPERFMGIIWSMVEPFGIDKVQEVMHYVELLGQAVDRHVFDSMHATGSHRKSVDDRKSFIVIFKQRHLHHTDLEYGHPVTPVDAKLIGQVVGMIEEKGFNTDEFLRWVFEVFLEDNPKFNPPTIKFTCSRFVVDKFLYENRDRAKQKQEDEIKKKEALDVIGRAKVLIRISRGAGLREDTEKVIERLKQYRDGHIMLDELRIFVESEERQNNEKQNEATGGHHGDTASGA
jgi:hypothetical protein